MLNSEVRSVVSIIYQPTTEDITSQPQITLQPKAILKESIDRLNDKINGTLVGVNAGEDLGWTVAYNKQGKPISEKVYSIGEPKLEAINYFANDGSLKSSVHRDLEKNKEHVTTVNTVPWIEGEKIIGSIQSFVLNDSGKVTFERRFDDKNRLSQIQYFNPKSEPIAKNVYHYDGKGTLKSGEFYIDDKIHSRVNYEYQFDSKGNWTKRKGMFTISNKNDSEIPSETIVREYIYQDEKQN